jgi:hypothetical protein
MIKVLRQGDVLLIPVDAIPAGAKEVKRDDKGRIILAEGEVTGHAHAVLEKNATLFEILGADGKEAARFLNVGKDTSVKHEEHGEVQLTKGVYEVRRQREYQPDEIRPVAD